MKLWNRVQSSGPPGGRLPDPGPPPARDKGDELTPARSAPADRAERAVGRARHVHRLPSPRLRRADQGGPEAQHQAEHLVHKEDVDLVENVQAGIATRGYRPGPLSRGEDAVASFAGKIRADLEAER